MLSQAEEWQILVERIADHLIDDDRYFELDAQQLQDFYGWAEVHHPAFTDCDGLDIAQMFERWISRQDRIAA